MGTFHPDEHEDLDATLKGSGSSFQEHYLHGAADTLAGVIGDLHVSYAGGGSGQGKSDLADGVVDFAGTDSPIGADSLAGYDGEVLYFPTVVAPITVSYNLDDIGRLKLDGPSLAAIFATRIASWSDPSITRLNPGLKLPDRPITVCRRADASGTTANFTRFLDVAGDRAWPFGSSDTVAWPRGTQGAQGNGGVAQCIAGKQGSIGYVDFSDAKAQHLDTAAIRNRAGRFIEPNLAGASAAAAGAEVDDDLTYDPIDAKGAEAYPITSPTWIIVMARHSDPTTAEALRTFLEFILTDGQNRSFTASMHYGPLPSSLRRAALGQIDEIEVR